ncbi:FAD-dependent oxidoreductase [archaeon]|nr:FAD-dependent oxidoreductase [archaeon]
MKEKYDVVIIGCGPAGLTAAVFCGRAGLKTVVIGLAEKSQASIAMHIENYPGFPDGIDGPILLNKIMIQAQKFGVNFVKEEVVSVVCTEENNKNIFTVKTSKEKEFACHAIVVCTGVPIRLSGIKNEEKLTGKGVHYCVSCDGPMYKNKKIAIVGNGNHAAESAIEALSYSKDITIVSNAPAFDFSDAYMDEIKKWQIKAMITKVSEFRGDKKLESLLLGDGKETTFDCVFMACGIAGAFDFASNLGLETKDNILVVDENSMTNLAGVFAAGNCAGRCRQIAKNIGDGCNAAINVIRYLRSKDLYFDYVHAGTGTSIKKDDKPVSTAIQSNDNNIIKKKLWIGWFSFSCCEDSTIVFTEMMNDYWDKWKDVIEIRHARVLKGNNDLVNLDIAFVEGAISNEKSADELREIRKNCKKLIAVGSCAVTGMPSGQRNEFDDRRKREIAPIVDNYHYMEKVVPLHDIVQVDDNIPGCPMLETRFLNILDKYLKEFGINAQL